MAWNTDRIVSVCAMGGDPSSVYGDQWHLRSDHFVPEPGPAAPLR